MQLRLFSLPDSPHAVGLPNKHNKNNGRTKSWCREESTSSQSVRVTTAIRRRYFHRNAAWNPTQTGSCRATRKTSSCRLHAAMGRGRGGHCSLLVSRRRKDRGDCRTPPTSHHTKPASATGHSNSSRQRYAKENTRGLKQVVLCCHPCPGRCIRISQTTISKRCSLI